MTRKQIRIGIGIAGAVLAYTVAWFFLANAAENRVMRQLQAQAAHGVVITVASHGKSGYPFALRVTLKEFNLTGRSGVMVARPRLVLGTSLFDATHLTVSARDGTLVTVPASEARAVVRGAIETVTGNLHLGLSGLRDARLALEPVTVDGLVPAEKPVTAASVTLSLEKPEPEPADHTLPGAHLTADIATLFLPEPQIAALGNTVDHLSLDAMLMGRVPLLNEASMAAWRDEGGTIEIRAFSGQWAQLNFGLGGTLALDSSFQPEGSFDAHIDGFDEAIDALAGTHAIKAQYSDLIKMGLSVIAKPVGDQNVPTLTVPLTIQDRVLYLSRFKIMKLPEVRLF